MYCGKKLDPCCSVLPGFFKGNGKACWLVAGLGSTTNRRVCSPAPYSRHLNSFSVILSFPTYRGRTSTKHADWNADILASCKTSATTYFVAS